MDIETIIYIGGIYHIGWALFDSFWPKVFNWKETLAPLDDLNRILLHITSQLLVVLYLGLAYISFFNTSDLLSTNIGKAVLIFISFYWIVRAVMQIYYFGLKKANDLNMSLGSYLPVDQMSNQAVSYCLLITFFIGIVLYTVPLVSIL